jgi:hypothetical protein
VTLILTRVRDSPAGQKYFKLSCPGRKLFLLKLDYRESESVASKGEQHMNESSGENLPMEFTSCTLEIRLADLLRITPGSRIVVEAGAGLQGTLQVGSALLAETSLHPGSGGFVLVVEKLLLPEVCPPTPTSQPAEPARQVLGVEVS